MSTAKLSGLMGRLGRGDSDGLRSAADGELLTLFVATRNEEAFAELVRRHGGLVFGVCRRVAGNHHLAEDAFQAVFVVLATKAAAVRPPSAVAAFLQAVAWRTALRARTMADRRRRREAFVAPSAEPTFSSIDTVSDAVDLLDEEIARLPEHYRLPLVLCELEGQTRKEVAGKLGIAAGTLSSRLAKARKRLAYRLRQRGIMLSTGALMAAVSQAKSAQLQADLIARAALAATHETIPTSVAELSKGVLRLMFLDKLKTTLPLAMMAVGFLACAAITVLAAASPLEPPAPPRVFAAKPVLLIAVPTDPPPPKTESKPDADKPAGVGHILIWKQGKHILLSPEGKELEELPENKQKIRLLTPAGKTVEIPHPEKWSLTDPSLSPDGKRVAFITLEAPPGLDRPLGRDRDFNFFHNVSIFKLDGTGEGQTLGLNGNNLDWTPDGKLIVVEVASDKDLRTRKFTTWLVDVGTKEKTKLDVPETAQIFCVTPDGKSYIATTYDFDKKQFYIVSISRDGNTVSELTRLEFGIMTVPRLINPRLSPDGSRILFLDTDKEEKLEEGMRHFPRLYLYDLKTKKREKLADISLDAFIWDYAWSPDSKRVAYVWKRMEPGVPLASSLDKDGKPKEGKVVETETHLNVADPSGKNTKTILSAKGRSGPSITLDKMEWR